MESKTSRWNLRVTPAQDAVVRRLCEATGESLNEFVVRHVVRSAEEELADRRAFAIDDAAWAEFEALLDRPPVHKPELGRLLRVPSVLEQPER